jgi:hypothetical protein
MKTYYVYQVTNPENGEFYIGSRGFEGLLEEDDYTGSPYVWDKPKNLTKVILKSGFDTMENAIEYEREMIITNINNPLNQNYSIPHPKWNRDGKVTAKNKDGKIISVSINDPLLKKSLFGVTKGKVVVRDEDGNTFMTDVNNPDYISGKLVSANKGMMMGESHPNYNKKWMNDGNKQVNVKDEDIQYYLDKGWVIGTLQKGKTTPSSHVGSCWIHNIELQETKRISKSELDYYLSIGWKPNRLKLGKYGKKI